MEIRKTMGRFVSIFFIVALGVAFYSGIRASEPSMRISGDSYFDKEELMDVRVMGTMGLTEEDVRAIEETDGIERAEGGYSKDVLCTVGDNEKVVHILSTQKNFNQVHVTEGRLPEKAGECLVDEDFLAYENYRVGDRISFRSGDKEPLTDTLTTDTFEIVGIGNSPLYISFGRGNSMIGTGEVSGFAVVAPASFKMDVYTEVYASVSDAFEQTAYTKEYTKLTDEAVSALKGIEKERCLARRDEVLGEADAEVADAQKTLDEESGKLAEAKEELADARSTTVQKLAEARKKLIDGEAALAASKKQIADGEKQIADGKAQLTAREAELMAGEAEYEAGVKALAGKEAELLAGEKLYQENYNQYMPAITEGKKQMAASRKELESRRAAAQTELDALKKIQSELARIDKELAPMEAERQQYESELRTGEALYAFSQLIPEGDRSEEQQAYVDGWPEKKAILQEAITASETREADLQAARAEQIRQMQALGVLTETELNTRVSELERSLADIKKLEEVLSKAEEELLAQEKKLTDAGKEIADGKKQIADAKQTLAASKKQIDNGKKQIKEAWKLIYEKEAALNAGKRELEAGEKELSGGLKEYDRAVTEATGKIADGETQITDGENELIRAQQKIADAKAEIAKVENPKWYVQDRSEALAEYDGYGENADRMRAIGRVFPVLFFLVAALISLTTMTRREEEQRVQIGTLKALGYSKFSIAKKYVYYALAATLGGSVLGVLVGEKLLPFIIIFAYKILYKHIPDILVPYHMSYAVQATVIAVACTLLATLFSCYRELAAQPAELMRPAAPKQGKRILLERVTFLWKRLNFTWKSTVRNLIRYKKRFFMTIFGIGGCMALMVVGFGLKDCIYEIVELQYEKVQFYDAAAYLEDEIPEEERQKVLDELDADRAVDGFIQTRMQKVKVRSASDSESLYLMVPADEEKIEDFLSFHSRTKQDESYSLGKDEVILTEKMSQLLGVKEGDTLTIEDEERGSKEVEIGAVCENYMGHYLYLSPEKYEKLYGAQARYNSVIYRVEEGEEDQIEKIGTRLLENDSVLNVSYTKSIEGRLDDMLGSLNLVIVVLIVSAGMLAFVVLYNLNNINITERQRELATLKVLGFFDMEVASYVYRENVLLTIIGSVVGMGLGKILHRFIIVTVEVNEAMFGRVIHWQSYLYSFLFTVGFSLFVNWVMFYKLRRINMVESLKSVE